MQADNSFIADQFSLLSKLMEIHGENSFKAKAYAQAAFAIDKLPEQLYNIPVEKISSIKGIGDSAAKKISEVFETGNISALANLLNKTPQGILEMLTIKGIGPKKIATIWKEMEVESIGELLYACNENRLLLYKGFGEKTQLSVKQSIEFYMSNVGSYLYAQIENYIIQLDELLKSTLSNKNFILTGDCRRHSEIIDKIEYVTDADIDDLQSLLIEHEFTTDYADRELFIFKSRKHIHIHFHFAETKHLYTRLFTTSCSKLFLQEWQRSYAINHDDLFTSEEEIFNHFNLQYIPAPLREKSDIINQAKEQQLPALIQQQDVKAIIHCHSKWSDGTNSLAEMAGAAKQQGFEYMVISDHSKTAFYANGLNEERLKAQHSEIDELNSQLQPFKIFKSIESDILNDGNLDYEPKVLHNFDVVIASVHSNLKMTEDKAMMRLLTAIENPFTSILGHMTGRLLLSRNGYPVNHKKIIDACAANNVVIELNAHPRRLDIDWRWIDYCLGKNVLISIDPDAHSIAGFNDIRYGVLAAQKAGVTRLSNLSSYPLPQFEKFVQQQKQKRPSL